MLAGRIGSLLQSKLLGRLELRDGWRWHQALGILWVHYDSLLGGNVHRGGQTPFISSRIHGRQSLWRHELNHDVAGKEKILQPFLSRLLRRMADGSLKIDELGKKLAAMTVHLSNETVNWQRQNCAKQWGPLHQMAAISNGWQPWHWNDLERCIVTNFLQNDLNLVFVLFFHAELFAGSPVIITKIKTVISVYWSKGITVITILSKRLLDFFSPSTRISQLENSWLCSWW